MKYLAYLLVFILSTPALAVIDVSNSNFSTSVSSSSVTDTQVTIWGGVSGTTTNDGTAVRSSCAVGGGSLEDCNKRQVGDGVLIRVTFTSDSEINNGTAFIRKSDETTNLGFATYTKGQTVTVQVAWSQLCENMSGTDSTCATTASGDFLIGVQDSTDTAVTDTIPMKAYLIATKVHSPTCSSAGTDGEINVGIIDYSAYMGDEKVYFPGDDSPLQAQPPIEFCAENDGSVATPIGGEIVKVVAFYSLDNLADISSASKSKTMDIDGDYPAADLDPGFIEKFDNEVAVFTRLAVQDAAGNIMGITPTADQEAAAPSCPGINKDTSTDAQIFECKYSTFPLEVAGLLAEDVNCFIATATFGSNMHDKVKDLRAFRTKILLKSKPGVWLVKKYYKWGSYGSQFIVNSPTLKKITRIALLPAWLFAAISLKIGFWLTTLLTLLLSFSLFLFSKKLFNTKRGALS